jgi:hypothetical protein
MPTHGSRQSILFAVVPKSRRCRNIQELKRELGEEYCEVPIYGKAGTAIIVDRETIHTRLDPLVDEPARGRRTPHHVFARAGEMRNFDGSLRTANRALDFSAGMFSRGLAGERLTRSLDLAIRRLYSLWSPTQEEWDRTGYDLGFVSDPKSARGSTVGVSRNQSKT